MITAAKDLKRNDRIQSASGKILTVTSVKNTENKTIVLFDGDMEIDFAPYTPLKVINKSLAQK